ncbi:MAG: CsbD family protein [Limnothrix sp. RL_2_0]|nr:CsbD family protein [Limnothrix sp. RL_2_0]
MISSQQIRNFFFIPCLTAILSVSAAFGFAVPSSFAAPFDLSLASHSQPQLVPAFWDKAKSKLKDAEGKAQETFGDITDSPKNQAMGKAKQVESKIRGAAADMKGEMDLEGRAKAVSKSAEGKAQSAMGDITGNLGDQISGALKQVEGKARSSAEDMKDFAQDILD